MWSLFHKVETMQLIAKEATIELHFLDQKLCKWPIQQTLITYRCAKHHRIRPMLGLMTLSIDDQCAWEILPNKDVDL